MELRLIKDRCSSAAFQAHYILWWLPWFQHFPPSKNTMQCTGSWLVLAPDMEHGLCIVLLYNTFWYIIRFGKYSFAKYFHLDQPFKTHP